MPPESWQEDLGKQIRDRREAMGWTQKKLARECGVSALTIGNIENGLKQPKIGVVTAICKALKGPPFTVRGCQIGEDLPKVQSPQAIAVQMMLALETPHKFEVTSVRVSDETSESRHLSFRVIDTKVG